MVVMSNFLNQAGKETLTNTVFIQEAVPKSFYGHPKEVTPIDKLQNTPTPIGAQQLPNRMPEPFISTGGYYANSTGFPMSYAGFGQPAPWSTGTNNPQPAPQNFDHTAMPFSTLNQPAPAQANAEGPQNHQFVTADHLFNQSTSAYQNAFSGAPYMNGNWSYFNNANSFFFPTGNADLNLTWGTAATDNPQSNALFHDLYKPHPLPVDQEKSKMESVVPKELSSAFENHEVKTVESVEQSFSTMSMNSSSEKEKEKVSENSVQNVNVVSTAPPSVVTPPVQVSSSSTSSGQSNAPAKPVSWAAVASQPAKNKAPTKKPPTKTTISNQKPSHVIQNGVNNGSNTSKGKQFNAGGRYRQSQGNNNTNPSDLEPTLNDSHVDINRLKDSSALLKKLMVKYNFNPREFTMDLKNSRFFIIKSYSEDDIFRSIKYSSWTSTEHGNRKLNEAFKEQRKNGSKTPLYLLFSVNSSGHFCGVAEMTSEVDLNVETGIWVQDKWKGRFSVRWIYVKDVPNNILRHIRLENNENKPVTNSRDTQEVHSDKAKQVLIIIHNFKAQTSIFDDFSHYEKRQEEDAKMRSKKMPEPDI